MSILIIANGDLDDTAWVEPYLDAAATVIAADGGAHHLLRMGRFPDIVVGDLDSLGSSARKACEDHGVEFQAFSPTKDETDLELALLFAASRFDDEIQICGGFGGRLDQLLANVLLLVHPDLRHCPIRFLTEYQQTWLLQDEGRIHGDPGDMVSLIPLGGDVHVLKSSGLQWSLENEVLEFGPARGISNRLVRPVATVTVASGYLLCVHTKQVWQR